MVETQLRRLRPEAHAPQADHSIDIVIIADIEPQASWTSSLLDLLAAEAPQAQVFIFEYAAVRPTSSIWQFLITTSEDLLNSIGQATARFQLTSRPLFFICHGLGGIILKRFLAILYDNFYHPSIQPLRNAQAGTVFLGTPHPRFQRREQWSQLTLILRACTSLSKKSILQAEAEAAKVATVSLKFEEAGIDTPVLSAYEGKRTHIKKGLFRLQKKILVERNLAETFSRAEDLVEVDADHIDIGELVPGSRIAQEIRELVRSAPARLRSENTVDTQVGAEEVTQPLGSEVWEDNISIAETIEEFITGLRLVDSEDADERETSADIAIRNVIPQAQEFIMQVKIPEMPCYVRRPHHPNPDFVGREDILLQLDEALIVSDQRTGPWFYTLCGLGGLGKTQIAIEFAFSRESSFDAIFWVQADETAKLAESFDRIAQRLGLVDASDVGDRDVSRNAVLNWLTNPIAKGCAGRLAFETTEAKWLLVFDNADNLELINDYWPIEAKGAILVTTRDPLAKRDLTSNAGVDLRPFTLNNSAALLRKLTGEDRIPGTEDDALALARRVSGLPLAITQIAALISRREMTIGEFLGTYGEEPSLAEINQGQSMLQRDRDRQTLSTVWQLEKFSPQALSLLYLLSFLDPDQIRESILTKEISTTILADYPSTKVLYIQARTELRKASLIGLHKESQSLSLHRLVQEVARDSMTPETLRNGFELAIKLLFHAWPEQYVSGSLENQDWEASDEVVAHIVKAQHVYIVNRHWNSQIQIRRQFVKLLQNGGWYLIGRSEFKAAKPMLELALQMCEESAGEMSDLHVEALFGLAKLGSWTNMDPQLILDLSRRHLELSIKINDGSVDGLDNVVSGHSNFGMACMLNGKHEEAIEHCKISEDLDWTNLETLDGKGFPHFARIYRAWSLSALDRNEEAVKLLQEVLDFRERTYGPDDTQSVKLAYTLYVLGYVRARQGLTDLSFDAYQKALRSFRATVGNNHLSTGETCLKQAEFHADMGQPETASVYFDQALKIFQKDSYHQPEVARTLFKQAEFLEKLGDTDEAQNVYMQAKAIYQAIVPDFKDDRLLTGSDFDSIVFYWSR